MIDDVDILRYDYAKQATLTMLHTCMYVRNPSHDLVLHFEKREEKFVTFN